MKGIKLVNVAFITEKNEIQLRTMKFTGQPKKEDPVGLGQPMENN